MWCEWIPLQTALPPIRHSQRVLRQECKSLSLLFRVKGRVQTKQVTYSWQGFDRTGFYLVKWVCLHSKFSTVMVPTWHYLQGLHFCLKTNKNCSTILVTVTRISFAVFASWFSPHRAESRFPFLIFCNSDPCFPSGWCIRPTPVCRVRAVFALSELYLSFSSPSGRVCESRQAVFAERFVIIRRASLGQRSRAPLPGYANSPSSALLPVPLNGVSAEAWRPCERDRGEIEVKGKLKGLIKAR